MLTFQCRTGRPSDLQLCMRPVSPVVHELIQRSATALEMQLHRRKVGLPNVCPFLRRVHQKAWQTHGRAAPRRRDVFRSMFRRLRRSARNDCTCYSEKRPHTSAGARLPKLLPAPAVSEALFWKTAGVATLQCVTLMKVDWLSQLSEAVHKKMLDCNIAELFVQKTFMAATLCNFR